MKTNNYLQLLSCLLVLFLFTSCVTATDYLAAERIKNIERARYWQERGYTFNPNFMSAYQMDEKVKDTKRAQYWKTKGYTFNPNFMSAYQMNEKVKDIERAKYWKEKGYTFNSNFMSAYQMNKKVKYIERAKYWKEKGYTFDPNKMSAYQMDQSVANSQNGIIQVQPAPKTYYTPRYRSYEYDIEGYNDEGEYLHGNIDVDRSGGDGYLYDEDGDEIYIDVEWTGKGTLEGYDEEGNYYELEVD